MINVNVSQPNDGLGDKLRDAFIIVNDNFNELFSLIDGYVDQSELDSAIDSINSQLNTIVTNINNDLTNILNILDTKSDIGHTHLISEISGLQTILNSLVTSTIFNTQITSINSQIASINDILLDLQNQINNLQDQINNIPPNDLQSVTNAGNTTSTNIVANGGIEGSTDYASFQLLSPYYNDMKWFRFLTNGDGTDFSVNSGVQFVMNPEEGLYMQRYDYDNNISSALYLGPGSVNFNNSYGTYSSYIQLDEMANINLSSSGFTSRLRTDLLTDNRTFQFPDGDGILALKSDLDSINYIPLTGTTTSFVSGDIEFEILTGLKRVDGDITKRVWFNDDGYVTLLNYNSVTGNIGTVDVSSGNVYINAYQGGNSNYLNIESDGVRIRKPLYIYDTEYSEYGSVRFNDNQLIVDGAGSQDMLNFGLGYYQHLNANNRVAMLNFANIATTNKTFTFPNATGTIALTSDISSATASIYNNIVKQTVTNGVTSSAPSQDAVYDFVTAAIASSTVSLPTSDVWKKSGMTMSATNSTDNIYRSGTANIVGSNKFFSTGPTEADITNEILGTNFGHISPGGGTVPFIQLLSNHGNGSAGTNHFIGRFVGAGVNNPQMNFSAIKSTSYDAWGDSGRVLFRFNDGYLSPQTKFDIGTDYIKFNSYPSTRNDIVSGTISNILYTDSVGTLKSTSVNNIFGFTPENVANKVTTLSGANNTTYPTSLAVANAIASATASIPTSTPSLSQVTAVGATTSTLVRLNGGIKSDYNDNYLDFRPDFGYSEIFFDSGFSNTLFSNSSSNISMEAYDSSYSIGSNFEFNKNIIDMNVSSDYGSVTSYFKIQDDNILLQSGIIRLKNDGNKSAILSTDGYSASGEYTFKFPEMSGTFSLKSDLASATTSIYNNIVKQTITNGVTSSCPSQDVVFDALALKANDNNVVKLSGDQSIGDVKTFDAIDLSAADTFQLRGGDGTFTINRNENPFVEFSAGDDYFYIMNSVNNRALFQTNALSANRSYTLPNASGTFSLTSDLANYVTLGTTQSITGSKTFTYPVQCNGAIRLQDITVDGYANFELDEDTLSFYSSPNSPYVGSTYRVFSIGNGSMVLATSNTVGNLITVGATSTLRTNSLIDANGKIPAYNSSTPSAPNATGVVGEIRADSDYIYVCISTNHWVRSATDASWS